MVKNCRICKNELTTENWSEGSQRARKYLCNPCGNQYSRELYKKHREHRIAKDKAWRLANPEKVKASQRRYYYENREVLLKKQAAWRKADGQGNVRAQGWRDANREHYRTYQREYQRKLRAKRLEEPKAELITPRLEAFEVENISGIEVRRYD